MTLAEIEFIGADKLWIILLFSCQLSILDESDILTPVNDKGLCPPSVISQFVIDSRTSIYFIITPSLFFI